MTHAGGTDSMWVLWHESYPSEKVAGVKVAEPDLGFDDIE